MSNITAHSTTIDDAVDAYANFCERSGVIFEQPSHGVSRLVKSACPYWLLVNIRGTLARVDAGALKVHGDTPKPRRLRHWFHGQVVWLVGVNSPASSR